MQRISVFSTASIMRRGLLAVPFTRFRRPTLATGAKNAGRSLSDLDLQVGVGFEIGDNVERMIAARKPAMAFTLGAMGSAKTNFYNAAYRRAGYEDAAIEVQRLWIDHKREEAAQRVPDEMILKGNLIGTPDMIRERLRLYRDAGITTLRLATGGKTWRERTGHLEEAMDLVRSEVTSWG